MIFSLLAQDSLVVVWQQELRPNQTKRVLNIAGRMREACSACDFCDEHEVLLHKCGPHIARTN